MIMVCRLNALYLLEAIVGVFNKVSEEVNMAISWEVVSFNIPGGCPSSSLCSYVPGAGFRFVTLPMFSLFVAGNMWCTSIPACAFLD